MKHFYVSKLLIWRQKWDAGIRHGNSLGGRGGGGGGAFYLSIGPIDTIGTNGITFIPMVFHWWNASHYLNISAVGFIGWVGGGGGGGAFYFSIGRICAIGIKFIPLVRAKAWYLIYILYFILCVFGLAHFKTNIHCI